MIEFCNKKIVLCLFWKKTTFFCSSISRFSHFLHVSLGIEWVILWKKDIQVYGKPKLYDLVMICVAQIMFAKMILLSERRNKQTKKKQNQWKKTTHIWWFSYLIQARCLKTCLKQAMLSCFYSNTPKSIF